MISRRLRSVWVRVFAIAFAVVVVGALIFFGKMWQMLAEPQPIPPSARTLTVANAETIRHLTPRLAERGLVRHPRLFLWWAERRAVADRLVAVGGYLFRERESLWEILTKLEQGKPDLLKVTIPEGLMARQIAERLEERGITSAAQCKRLLQNPDGKVRLPDWAPRDNLEGFLFPDTYYLRPQQPAEKVIEQMLRRFEEVVIVPHRDALAKAPTDGKKRLSLREVVALASLIEREVVLPQERAVVAGVYLNRLRQGEVLACDATIQYALGYWKKRLFNSDKAQVKDSPYNTYRRRGLPPTPIASPGLPCILSALHPAQTDYFYYVARGDGSMGHYFSRTSREHERARQRYKENLRQRAKEADKR